MTATSRFDAVLGAGRGRLENSGLFSVDPAVRAQATQKLLAGIRRGEMDESFELIMTHRILEADVSATSDEVQEVQVALTEELWRGARQDCVAAQQQLRELFPMIVTPALADTVDTGLLLDKLEDAFAGLPGARTLPPGDLTQQARATTLRQCVQEMQESFVDNAYAGGVAVVEALLPEDKPDDDKALGSRTLKQSWRVLADSGLSLTQLTDLMTRKDWESILPVNYRSPSRLDDPLFYATIERKYIEQDDPMDLVRATYDSWVFAAPRRLDSFFANELVDRLPVEAQANMKQGLDNREHPMLNVSGLVQQRMSTTHGRCHAQPGPAGRGCGLQQRGNNPCGLDEKRVAAVRTVFDFTRRQPG